MGIEPTLLLALMLAAVAALVVWVLMPYAVFGVLLRRLSPPMHPTQAPLKVLRRTTPEADRTRRASATAHLPTQRRSNSGHHPRDLTRAQLPLL